jgi:hypothetical protein
MKEKLQQSSIIVDLEALAEVRPLTVHEIELKSQSNAQLEVFFVRRSLSGTSDRKLNLFWKRIQIQDISIVLPMADTRRNVFIS